ncbi:MAG TPA: hypothetical protein VNT75_04975 [Symbiobacteriaceae bacterium]|nr:hypothetical protein [Symbiobacteriaceae bacterium]
MGMPVIPDRTAAQVRLDLLESIALEETALAHLINAEAEKVQALADDLPKPCTFEEAAEMQKLILAILQAAQLKELILNQKLKRVMQLGD